MEKTPNIIVDTYDFFEGIDHWNQDKYRLGEIFRDTCLIPNLRKAMEDEIILYVMLCEHVNEEFVHGCFDKLMNLYTKDEIKHVLFLMDNEKSKNIELVKSILNPNNEQ